MNIHMLLIRINQINGHQEPDNMIQASVTFVYELARIKDVQAAVKDVESSVGIIIITCSDSSKGGHYDVEYDVIVTL